MNRMRSPYLSCDSAGLRMLSRILPPLTLSTEMVPRFQRLQDARAGRSYLITIGAAFAAPFSFSASAFGIASINWMIRSG